MSSVGKMAVAEVVAPPIELEGVEAHSTWTFPWPPSPDGVLARAFAEDARTASGGDLAELWVDFAHGRLHAWRDAATPERLHLIARTVRGPTATLRSEVVAMVANMFCGEAGKSVASDLGIAASTAARHRALTLAAFRLGDGPPPLPLVLAAQSRAGVTTIPTARIVAFDHEGATYVSASVPRPDASRVAVLTPAEREIAVAIMQGERRHEIANRRSSSRHTVSAQVHSIYAALGVTGRCALIRRAAELRCFG